MRYILLSLLFLLACAAAWADRATATAMRVPDGAITVDASFADWARIAAPTKAVSDTDKLWLPAEKEFGEWSGPDDSSFTTYLAHDSAYLYLYAQVRDQALVNVSTADAPFNGDDFEVFISAGPDDVRFSETKTADYRQLVFLPGRINPAFPKTLIWQEKDNPGVQAVSRLTLHGYDIELRIPTALFPNWKAHPGLASIGFDCQINDVDAPGIDCHHPCVKGARQLLSLGRHFQSPKDMGLLLLDDKTVKLGPPSKIPNLTTPADSVMAKIDVKDAAKVVANALKAKEPEMQFAAAKALALRPDLSVPNEPLVKMLSLYLAETKGPVYPPECIAYVLRAQAERQKLSLPTGTEFFLHTDNRPLRLTYIYCLGLNGDKAATPILLPLLKDTGLRTRQQAAIALALLKDPAALPALQEMEKNDPDMYAKKQATLAIAAITGKK